MVLTEQLVDFTDLDTKVRINPATHLIFEEDKMVTLQHPHSAKGVRIQYDIMLILYPMTEWITVGELCEGWPPEDQKKIKSHLGMLHESRVVITESTQEMNLDESVLPENLGDSIKINIENHHHMLRDSIRMACYQRAINNLVNEDSIVLDLGSGSGILSFFAARAGAKKVYGIEKRPDMVMVSRELAKENGFDEVVTIIENTSQAVKAEDFEEKPNLFVSEILGNAILEENVLEFTIDARDRLLEEGATLIPCALDIMIVPIDSGHESSLPMEVAELEDVYGFKLGIFKTVLSQKPSMKLINFEPDKYNIMGEPVCAKHLDMATIDRPMFESEFEYEANKDGYVNGFCAYFKAHMDKETVLTNSPWAPPTHWTQMVYNFPTRRPVKKGEILKVKMVYDGSFTLWYPDEWEGHE